MLNIPPHLEACRPRGLFSIFHGTSSPVARRCPRASDLVLSAEHAFLLYERPGLHLQSGASAVGGVLRGARRFGKRSPARRSNFNPRAAWARQDLPTVLKPVAAISIHAPHGRGGVSAGRPAGRRFLRPGPSCAYRARFDCRSGTIRRGRTGCRCSWTYPTHPIERDRTHRMAGHTLRSR